MNFSELNKYFFKLRSLPNSQTMPLYFERFVYFMAVLFVYNFISICLFQKDFSFTIPTMLVLAFPIIFLHLYSTIESNFKDINKDKIKDVIVLIRLKQHQSLIEKLQDNPELLKSIYNKKSLLSWAKHHNNLEAHSIIINLMKKNNFCT